MSIGWEGEVNFSWHHFLIYVDLGSPSCMQEIKICRKNVTITISHNVCKLHLIKDISKLIQNRRRLTSQRDWEGASKISFLYALTVTLLNSSWSRKLIESFVLVSLCCIKKVEMNYGVLCYNVLFKKHHIFTMY